MVKLPPLGDDNRILSSKKKEVQLPEVNSFDPNIRKEKILGHFSEIVAPKEDFSNENVEETFRSILSLAKNNRLKTEEDYERELKNRGLYDIDLLNEAIEAGELNIDKYNLIVFSKVTKKLEQMKEKHIVEKLPLESHGIKNQDEFYDLIAIGKIDLERYSDEEIDSFIKSLGGK